jgi:hypothetical protein
VPVVVAVVVAPTVVATEPVTVEPVGGVVWADELVPESVAAALDAETDVDAVGVVVSEGTDVGRVDPVAVEPAAGGAVANTGSANASPLEIANANALARATVRTCLGARTACLS